MKMNLRELQLAELEILKEFIRICEKNNLIYYLAWGTCLGAIRHKGFIPWDDDIDVTMPYKDYVKFKEVCKAELGSEFFYQDYSSDPNYINSFAKIRQNNTSFLLESFAKIEMHWGIYLDIFPLYDYDSPQLSRPFEKELRLYRQLYLKNAYTKRKFYKVKGFKTFFKVLCRCLWYLQFPEKRRFRLIRSIEEKLCNGKGHYYLDPEVLGFCQPFKKEWFGEGSYVDFEGITARVPKHYEEYLKHTYGDDCLEIPQPGSAKITCHEGAIIDLHKSYLDYQKEMK